MHLKATDIKTRKSFRSGVHKKCHSLFMTRNSGILHSSFESTEQFSQLMDMINLPKYKTFLHVCHESKPTSVQNIHLQML